MSCVICGKSKSGMKTIKGGKRICFSCIYYILYRSFDKDSKVGLQWLTQVWRKGKSREIIVKIAKKINTFIG